MSFDIATVTACTALVCVVLSIIMELFDRNQERFRGFGWLSVSYLAIGIGYGLIAMREYISVLFSFVAGTGLISFAFFFMHIGIDMFREIKSLFRWVHIILCASIIALTYLYSVNGSGFVHNVIPCNIIFSVQLILCIVALFSGKKISHHMSKYVVAFPLGMMLLSFLISTAAIYYSPPQEVISNTGSLHTLPLYISHLVMVVTALGFIWMSVNRAEEEKRVLDAELQGSLKKEQKISAKLQEQYNVINAFLDTVPVPIFFKNPKGFYQNVNSAFCEAMGLQSEEIIDRSIADIDPMYLIEKSKDADKLILETGEKQEYEAQILFGDGLRHEVIVNKAVFRDSAGKIAGIIGAITDITERKINEAKIQHMALHDQLTGLANRNMFFALLDKALAKAKRHGYTLALLYIDLDGFKAINDELGHDVGDMVLKVVGKRLSFNTRKSDTVCRLGGDEFALLAEMVEDHEAMASIAEKIIQSISETISAMGKSFHVGASVGIAVYPDHASDSDTIMKKADLAMYKAKRKKSGSYCFYTD